MNNTPIPRTDERKISFALDTIRQLETELNEAREQLKKTRKHLKDANRGAEINAHALRINSDRLAFATLERDAWKAKYIQQNKDLGCEMMDPNGTIWDYAKKLQTELAAVTEDCKKIEDRLRADLRGHPDSELWGDAGLIAATMRCVDAVDTITEQRDRLADALESVKCELRFPQPEYPSPVYLYSVKLLRQSRVNPNEQDRHEEFYAAQDIRDVWAGIALELADEAVEVESVTRCVPILSFLLPNSQDQERTVKGGSDE